MKWLDGLVAWLLRLFAGAEQRNVDLEAGLKAIHRANIAARDVSSDQESIDDDPNNLDRFAR
ncbi:MAG: hypothetical protein JSR91_18665 [Proteobacteria bacterium]|nr:hypothetical protein [Pseudomonadota bacterium]